jgi:Ring finger domain
MSTFFSQLAQIDTTSTVERTHNNPHAVPTPVDVAASGHLLQDQIMFFLQDSSNPEHRAFLERLANYVQEQIDNPPEKVAGVPQSFLDELDRVPKKALKKDDMCPICAEKFLDDEFPLVVQLPCHKTHRFDLECVGPWLRLQGTCPLDRKELMKKEVPKVEKEEEEEEDYDEMFA